MPRLVEGSLWKGRHFGRLFHGYLGSRWVESTSVSAERIWDEQSLISGWLESGEAKPPRQDHVGLCKTILWGVGYVKILVQVFKKTIQLCLYLSVSLS